MLPVWMECIAAGFTLRECTDMAVSAKAGGIGWFVPMILLLGALVLGWQERKSTRQD